MNTFFLASWLSGALLLSSLPSCGEAAASSGPARPAAPAAPQVSAEQQSPERPERCDHLQVWTQIARSQNQRAFDGDRTFQANNQNVTATVRSHQHRKWAEGDVACVVEKVDDFAGVYSAMTDGRTTADNQPFGQQLQGAELHHAGDGRGFAEVCTPEGDPVTEREFLHPLCFSRAWLPDDKELREGLTWERALTSEEVRTFVRGVTPGAESRLTVLVENIVTDDGHRVAQLYLSGLLHFQRSSSQGNRYEPGYAIVTGRVDYDMDAECSPRGMLRFVESTELTGGAKRPGFSMEGMTDWRVVWRGRSCE